MKVYNEFWQWIQAIQEYHPHTKTSVTILGNSIVVDSVVDNTEIAQWNNANSIGIVADTE